MEFNLFTNYYVDRSPNRLYELEQCLIKNITCKSIDKVILVVSPNHQMHFYQMLLRYDLLSFMKKIKVVIYENRPTYREWFSLTRKYSDNNSISCLSNTDIFFLEESVDKIKNFQFENATIMSLSRWDVNNIEDIKGAKVFDRSDSQDSWIVKSSFKDVPEANFTLGIAGCDNKIAYCLEQHGYTLINPCYDITSYHLHNSNVRNYINKSHVERLQPPYSRVIPVKL